MRRLEALMVNAGWSQALLAERLRVSPATVTRVLVSRAASPKFVGQAERLLHDYGVKEGELDGSRVPNATANREFRLLQKMYGLLVSVNSRVEALAAESRLRGGFEKEVK